MEELKECIWCGDLFIPTRSTQMFCSKRCGNRHRDSIRKVERPKKYCIVCGKEIEGTRRKYCSDYCSGISLGKFSPIKKKEVKKEEEPKLKTYVCEYCGKEFKGAEKRKYCTLTCQKNSVHEKQSLDGKASLCWICKNYNKDCSWSRDFIPVEGWKATRRIRPDTNEVGYKVIECPLFERG